MSLTVNSNLRHFGMGRTLTRVCAISVALALWPMASAQAGDAAAGQEKAEVCAACHGVDGRSEVAPINPVLAGQYESYLVHALRSYRSGTRQNAIMQGFATQLSDEDIDDLAAWFSSQQGPLTTARPN